VSAALPRASVIAVVLAAGYGVTGSYTATFGAMALVAFLGVLTLTLSAAAARRAHA